MPEGPQEPLRRRGLRLADRRQMAAERLCMTPVLPVGQLLGTWLFGVSLAHCLL
jgi:hypothetical protein